MNSDEICGDRTSANPALLIDVDEFLAATVKAADLLLSRGSASGLDGEIPERNYLRQIDSILQKSS